MQNFRMVPLKYFTALNVRTAEADISATHIRINNVTTRNWLQVIDQIFVVHPNDQVQHPWRPQTDYQYTHSFNKS